MSQTIEPLSFEDFGGVHAFMTGNRWFIHGHAATRRRQRDAAAHPGCYGQNRAFCSENAAFKELEKDYRRYLRECKRGETGPAKPCIWCGDLVAEPTALYCSESCRGDARRYNE